MNMHPYMENITKNMDKTENIQICLDYIKLLRRTDIYIYMQAYYETSFEGYEKAVEI